MSKILFLFLIPLFLLISLLLYFVPVVSADSNCRIYTIPETPIENMPPLSESTPEAERIIKFFIQPSDTTATYKLVFPRNLPGWEERDNLKTGATDRILRDSNNNVPSLQYRPGRDILSKSGEYHTFYLERKSGAPGKYCEGSYFIKKDVSGGIESCELRFTANPNETTNIAVEGSVKPANEDYQLSITGAARKNVKLNVDTNGNISSATIGQLNPGLYTATLQKKGLEMINDQPSEIYKDTNCQYSINVAQGGGQGSVSKIGQTGAVGNAPACTGPQCTSGGGEPCDVGRGPAFKTAIGCIHTNPTELIKDFLTFIIGISGGLAFLMMLLGAFQMLTSAGNPETLHAGKDRLTSAIIGLLFIIFAILLLQIIGVGILALPGFVK